MEQGNIFSLNGEAILDKRQASEQVVAELERLLALAKDGEIIGFAGVALGHDSSTWISESGNRYNANVIGQLFIMIQKLAAGN